MSFTFSTRGLMATIAAVATFAVAPVSAQTIVQPDNGFPSYGFGNSYFGQYVPTVGQSFVAVGSVLNSFSFWLSNENNGNTPNADQLSFQAYVAQWDGTGVVGPLLYSSAVQSGPSGLSQAYTFNTGALAVTNGASYIAFLTVPDLGLLISSAGVEMSNSSSSGGGVFFSFNSDVSAIVSGGSTEWVDGAGEQAHFEATFSAGESVVPEPATGILMGAGLLGVVVAARRRRA